MDFNIGIEDVGVAILQELWNRVALQAVELAKETRDVMIEKGSFREFSRSITELDVLLKALNVRTIEAAMGTESTKVALEKLNDKLRRARKIIKNYKAGSRLRFLLHSHSVLTEMSGLAKDIATTISPFQLSNLDMALNLKSMNDEVIEKLNSMEFSVAAATETIALEIENSVSQSSRNRENAVKLLEKIAEAVGADANVSLVQTELALLKQEKEEMEVQKKQAEALQLSQLMQLLYSTEIVPGPRNEEASTCHKQYPIGSFICPLCKEMMVDPVAVFCGHSFERNAIQEYFESGKKNCPTCKEEVQSLELTPNVNLRSSIEEWKKNDMDWRFQAAVSGINSDDHIRKNQALDDMQVLVEISHYAVRAAEEGLLPKFVEPLKDTTLNTKAAVKCLYCLAKYCDDRKREIIEAGAVRRIVKRIYNGETELNAIAILLELSKTEALVEKIGNTKDCIPLLVYLVSYPNPEIALKAQDVLRNLSSNTHFVVKMAESGFFQSFVARFNQAVGHQETRALLASALIEMQLKENSINDLKDKQFVHNLVHMLATNAPACKSACIKCVKKLIQYPKMVKRFLSDPATIPLVLNIISFRSDPILKQEAAEILALLVQACNSLAKQRTATALEHLSRSTSSLVSEASIRVRHEDSRSLFNTINLFPNMSWCCSASAENKISCPVHGIACSQRHTFCLVKADAVKPLLQTLSDTNSGVAEASLKALETLLEDHSTLSHATAAIVESQGVEAILLVLEKGTLSAKTIALDLFHKIVNHSRISGPSFQRSEGILIQLLHEDAIRKKVALVLKQMKQVAEASVIPLPCNPPWVLVTITPQAEDTCQPMVLQTQDFAVLYQQESNCHSHVTRIRSHDSSYLQQKCITSQTLSDTNSGVAEASLKALETLLEDHSTLSHATAAIVESQGVEAILLVLEKGTLSAKTIALDLFHKIVNHSRISGPSFQRSEGILIQLLHEDAIRKKVALVLKQMKVLPEQSSYF
ncbi:hypothetical protein GOBAR_AA28655 [Gossypium barbadense]|uniref:RING-type E3 ubiquitin transferase n=1 Tax=Gossypium barbadense TaxID=3634 RepID=A0A2P5WLR4_GOSBA|nr:hypothetical protein GOBAR_AA28655 [Gossypium barbadense]